MPRAAQARVLADLPPEHTEVTSPLEPVKLVVHGNKNATKPGLKSVFYSLVTFVGAVVLVLVVAIGNFQPT